MKTLRHLRAVVAAALLHLSAVASAQQFVVSTGAAGNTYDLMVHQLAAICQTEVDQPIISKPSSGSMENIDLLINNVVPAAIIQTDVLHYRAGLHDMGIVKALVTLHPEEVHIVALSAKRTFGGLPGIGSLPGIGRIPAFAGTPFNTLADLRGHKVGAWGGSYITAQVIQAQSEIAFQVIEYPDQPSALAALTAGSIDALISVGGSPQPWVQQLDRQYRLVPIADAEAAKLKGVYSPATLSSYGNLGQTGVKTVATDAILAVRDYKTPAMARLLGRVRACLRLRLAELQETPGNQAGWQRVGLDTKPHWAVYVLPAALVNPTINQGRLKEKSLAKTQ